MASPILMRRIPANEEVQLCAFDVLAVDGKDVRDLPLAMRKADLERLLCGRPDGIFINPFEIGAIGPGLFRAACDRALKAWSQTKQPPLDRRTGQGQEQSASCLRVKEAFS